MSCLRRQDGIYQLAGLLDPDHPDRDDALLLGVGIVAAANDLLIVWLAG